MENRTGLSSGACGPERWGVRPGTRFGVPNPKLTVSRLVCYVLLSKDNRKQDSTNGSETKTTLAAGYEISTY